MSALATFKREHGVATHRLTGAGHRYPVMAYFATITMKDGTRRAFTELAHEYSMATLAMRDKVTEGADELSACKRLAERNNLDWPDETKPKRK
jgi:hypothetical protein